MSMVLMDNELERLQNLVPILAINTTAVKEHVLEAERKIRLIKERGRGILNTLQFMKMHRLMLIELVYHVVLWLNAFSANSGVSETLSPRKMVYWHKLDFAKHCKSPFRTYCKVHDEPVPTNTMVTCSTPTIVLGPLETCKGLTSFSAWRLERRSIDARSCRTPCRTWSSRRSKRMASRPPSRVFLTSPTGTAYFLNGTRMWMSFLKRSLTLRTSSSTLPLLRNTQEWCLGEINPFHRSKRKFPQGQAEDAAARNANLQPFDVAEVAAVLIIHANANKLVYYKIDDNDGIIATPAPGLPVKGSSCERNVIKASTARILCEGSKGDRAGWGGSQSRHNSACERQQKEQIDVTLSRRQYPTVPAAISCRGIDTRFDGDIGYVVIDVSLLRRGVATRGRGCRPQHIDIQQNKLMCGCNALASTASPNAPISHCSHMAIYYCHRPWYWQD